jgi:hypothetical protein
LGSLAFTDAFILVAGNNMSAFIKKVTLKQNGVELDDTAFGDTTHSRVGGLKDYTLDFDWNQDFAAGGPDAILFPLFNTIVTFEVRPTSPARSATNPGYTGSVLLSDYSPFDGSVGDLLSLSTSWKAALPLIRNVA